jgi:hypothetical protein
LNGLGHSFLMMFGSINGLRFLDLDVT